jgi:hypothetical protein
MLIPGDMLFFTLGIILAMMRTTLLYASLVFAVISIPDLFPQSGVNPWQIAWHYLLLVIPGLLRPGRT